VRQLRYIKFCTTAPEPIAGSLEIGQQLLIGNRPGVIPDVWPTIKINPIKRNASPAPDDGCAAQLATGRQGHGRVQATIQLFSVGQTLGIGAEFFIPALDQQNVKSSARNLHRNDDTRGARAYYGHIGRQRFIPA
jgi:hypothetical protein